MKNINIPQLDTITKHIININDELIRVKFDIHTLDDNSDYDLIFKIATVIMTAISVIFAINLFFWNRKKEFYIKKAELAGNIYTNIFNFKKIRNDVMKREIDLKLFAQGDLMFNLAGDWAKFQLAFTFEDDENVTKQNEKIKELENIKNELIKYLGSYGFYCKNKRPLITKFCENLANDKLISIDFRESEHENIDDTIKELKILSNALYKKEIEKTNNFFTIIKALIDNEKY